MFICALSLSGAAAFYSIIGLMAIFAAAPVPVAIMGSLLEASKLVIASWLYRNWSEVPKLLKTYFTIALIVLMVLTSMGIFGFLSKAHLEQGVPTGEVRAKIELIDEKIKTEKDNINEARTILTQLDKQVNETITRTANEADTKGIDRSVTIRKQQSKERKQLYASISASQTEIAKLQQEKAPLATQARKIEAEVGPIKYIAALIYGDNPDQNVLEKAVRWVTIMIVSVFDPLAVLMLIAANWTLLRRTKEEKPKIELHDMSYYSDSKWTEEELKKAEEDNIIDDAYDSYKSIQKEMNTQGWKQEWVPETEVWPEYVEDKNQSEDETFLDEIVIPDEPKQTQENWGSRPPSHLKPTDPRHR